VPGYRLQAQDEVLDEAAEPGHARPGAREGVAAAGGERAGGSEQVVHVEGRPPGDLGRVERADGPTEGLEARRVVGEEHPILEALVEDHPQHGSEDGDVVTRARPEVDVGPLRDVAHSRVDDDQPHAARLRLGEPLPRVPVREAHVGHEGVDADEQDDLRVAEPLAGCHP
jgi:hypothetical protein